MGINISIASSSSNNDFIGRYLIFKLFHHYYVSNEFFILRKYISISTLQLSDD